MNLEWRLEEVELKENITLTEPAVFLWENSGIDEGLHRVSCKHCIKLADFWSIQKICDGSSQQILAKLPSTQTKLGRSPSISKQKHSRKNIIFRTKYPQES
jgi:hypothetical protein